MDKQPADSLSRVAAFNVEELLLKSSEISRGAIYNIHESLLEEWGPGSLGTLPEDQIQELLIEVMKPISFIIILYLLSMPIDIFHNLSFSILSGIRFSSNYFTFRV